MSHKILKKLIRSTTTKSMTGLDASAVGTIAIPQPKKGCFVTVHKNAFEKLNCFPPASTRIGNPF